ncbi:pilin [Candidatus Microgenomates bacterium]|nr:pilin [Candidatus Microgenomates bacterium]
MINKLINTVYAAGSLPPSSKGLGCGDGFGEIAKAMCNLGIGDSAKVGNQLNKALSGIIGFLTIVAGLWFIFQIIIAGYGWMNAGGDKNHLEEARNKIVNALIGLIIVVSAWVITGLIGKIIGLNILNPGAVLQNIGF